MDKKIVYIDMDGVLVDLVGAVYEKYIHALGEDSFDVGRIVDQDAEPFYKAEPIEGAIEAYRELSNNPNFEVYILSTAPWANPEALMAKRIWVEKHLGDMANRRLILSHHKNLLMGDYLIDDRDNNGATQFKGEHIKFGTDKFNTWKNVTAYLTKNS